MAQSQTSPLATTSEPDGDSRVDDADGNISTEDERHAGQRFQSVREARTGKSVPELMEERSERLEKIREEKNLPPLTEAELKQKETIKNAVKKRLMKSCLAPAAKGYDEFNFTAETFDLDISARGYIAQDLDNLWQVLLFQGLSSTGGGNLQQLNLRNNLVKDEGAAVLSNFLKHDENKVLKFLDLSLCSITHVGAKAIGEMLVDNAALLELRLKNNRIGSIGAASIAQGLRDNCCLETLSLKGNTICDPGCVPFAEISFGNLISLDLRANYIGNMGCKHLADGLKDNESIRRLSLRENNFNKEGKWALGEVLRKKKLAFWASERDAKVYYGADYVPKSDLEKSFIIPEIDFDHIRGIKPKGLLPTYIAYECCDCCCDIPIKNCCGKIKRETGCLIS